MEAYCIADGGEKGLFGEHAGRVAEISFHAASFEDEAVGIGKL